MIPNPTRKKVLERKLQLYRDVNIHTGCGDANNVFRTVKWIHGLRSGESTLIRVSSVPELYETAMKAVDAVVVDEFNELTIEEAVLQGRFVRQVQQPVYSFFSHTKFFHPTRLQLHPLHGHLGLYTTKGGRIIRFVCPEKYEGVVAVVRESNNIYNVEAVKRCVGGKKIKDYWTRVLPVEEVKNLIK